MCYHRGASARLIALAAALAISLSVPWTAAAELPELEDPVEVTGSQSGAISEEAWSGTPVTSDEAGIRTAAETVGGYTDPSGLVQGVAAPTTYKEVYDRMTAFKTIYPEGLAWTNFTPYGTSGPLGSSYTWHGGSIKGANGGVGCAAFAFILSDAAFGSLPARTIDKGGFTFDDVKVGDILRVNNNSHFVIVLQKSAAGVTVAEANYNSSVHWGRALSTAEIMAADFLVTRYPVNFVPSDAPDADQVAHSGTEGALRWALTSGGALTISGAGAIPDYSTEIRPSWDDYKDMISTVEIETGVTGIGAYAFYQSSALAVYLPDSITSIGASAFEQSALLSITIPDSVKSLGSRALAKCANLTSVTISNGVSTIESEAFRGCTSLAYIDFPASVTSLGTAAFMDCSKMTRVRFMPGSTTVNVGDNLFTNCWNLTDVTLPKAIDHISAGMFQSCKILSRIYIPAEVTEIAADAFMSCSALHYDGIYFGGSETTWNNIGGAAALRSLNPNVPTVYFNIPFDDPFAKDPNDPGDLPGDSDSSSHTHSWSAVWTYDGTRHWHECTAPDCPIDSNSQKDGYAAHSYGSWVTDVNATASQNGRRHRDCTICGYRQTEIIPTSGGSSDSDSSSDSSSSDSNSSISTTTTRNPDGSITTTTTDRRTGIKTETTKKPDGSSVVVTTDAFGRTKTSVELSASAVQTAQRRGEAVLLPIPEVRTAPSEAAAAPITVHTGQREAIKVAIPAVSPTAGTVVVLVRSDGSTEILKTSVTANGAVTVPLSDGAVVKIVDNTKRFADVPSGAWFEDAVTFVSARELFFGAAENTFDPNGLMTRAMLMTVLARFDGAETTGGASSYANGIEWAIAHGISDGTNPDQSITREQLVAMLWRYLNAPSAAEALPGYTDAAQISGYAEEAMSWAVKNGILSGVGDGRLDPQGQASRAQVAQILKRLIETVPLT